MSSNNSKEKSTPSSTLLLVAGLSSVAISYFLGARRRKYRNDENHPRPSSLSEQTLMLNPEDLRSLDKSIERVHEVLLKHAPSMPLASSADSNQEGMSSDNPTEWELPPILPRPVWIQLGEALQHMENISTENIPGHYWITLRCDGSHFSRLKQALLDINVFTIPDDDDTNNRGGMSREYTEIMQACSRYMLEYFSGAAVCAYTHSDEVTILIKPTPVIEGKRQTHVHGGRPAKLISLTASKLTAQFNFLLYQLFRTKSISYDPNVHLAAFDCRVGVYATKEQATSALLYRAYSCSVTGVGDAVLYCKDYLAIEGSKEALQLNVRKKYQFLADHNRLPLADHQVNGSYFVRKVISRKKRGIFQVDGNLLSLFREGNLL